MQPTQQTATTDKQGPPATAAAPSSSKNDNSGLGATAKPADFKSSDKTSAQPSAAASARRRKANKLQRQWSLGPMNSATFNRHINSLRRWQTDGSFVVDVSQCLLLLAHPCLSLPQRLELITFAVDNVLKSETTLSQCVFPRFLCLVFCACFHSFVCCWCVQVCWSSSPACARPVSSIHNQSERRTARQCSTRRQRHTTRNGTKTAAGGAAKSDRVRASAAASHGHRGHTQTAQTRAGERIRSIAEPLCERDWHTSGAGHARGVAEGVRRENSRPHTQRTGPLLSFVRLFVSLFFARVFLLSFLCVVVCFLSHSCMFVFVL